MTQNFGMNFFVFTGIGILINYSLIFSLAILEGVVHSRRRGSYDWRGLGVAGFDHFIRCCLTIFIPYSLATPMMMLAVKYPLFHFKLDSFASMFVLFLGFDFFYYWYHRSAHGIRWFWIYHSAHHSTRIMNLAAGHRMGILDKVVGVELFFVLLIWFGFSIDSIVVMATVNLMFQQIVHVDWIPRLGWLELIFVTPSNHRVHHAGNPEYRGKNFGGVLIIFDRIFGTYVAERADVPCVYGYKSIPVSYNPFFVEFRELMRFIRDLRSSRKLPDFVRHTFGMPRHD